MAEKKSGAKGFALEELLRASFNQRGYFVLGGLPYRVDGEDVTDIDLWLYERPVSSGRRRIIVDVRNRKSPKAAERLIWTKGLASALGVDSAMVATTDNRPATRRLARALGLTLLDGETMTSLTSETGSPALALSWADFNGLVKKVDDTRRSTDWRDMMFAADGVMLSGFGVQSANAALSTFAYFANQTILSQPRSTAAETANRVACRVAALALISIDFVIAEHSLRPTDVRRAVVVNAIRFGQAEVAPALASVRAAIGLARKHAQHGNAVARQIELGFRAEADEIPAEIIADFALRDGRPSWLFDCARELEAAATSRAPVHFDQLSVEARSALGAFLDYASVSREKFANSLGAALAPPSSTEAAKEAGDAGPLFKEPGGTTDA